MSSDPQDTAVEEDEFYEEELEADAYLHPDDELQAYGEERSPLIACLLQLAGGAGYFYANRPRRFGIVLVFFFALVLAWYHGLWGWMSHPLAFFGAWGAALLAVCLFVADAGYQVYTQRYYWREWYNEPWAYGLFAVVGFLPLVLLIFLSMDEGRAVKTLAISEGANTPSIQIGDRVILDMRAYDGVGPARGDVVYYRVKEGSETLYLNRVLGLPGDQLVFGNGRVSLNGDVLTRRESGQFTGAYYKGDTKFLEMLPDGPSYMTLISPNSSVQHDGKLYLVPQGHYFLVGDNRDSAWDSRFRRDHGFIARANILGKARGIIWSNDLGRLAAPLQAP